MLTIQIHDEQLARRLQQIAERENRPVEAVLRELVAHYEMEAPVETVKPERSKAVKRVRRKAYAKARQYWQTIGDTGKAAMTDEALDEQFAFFDEEGFPRLKSEVDTLEPPVGSLAYAAKVAEGSLLRSGKSDLARRSEEILDTHLADDFSKRRRGEDVVE